MRRLPAILRTSILAVLACICFAVGYLVGAGFWLGVWCMGAFVQGFKAVRG